MKSGHVTLGKALALLPPNAEGRRYAELLTHGSMRLGLYAPRGFDPQKPHEQDELYLVIYGTGTFVHEGRRTPFGPGDALFVAAGVEHRFEDFSDDFATWVVFWGPAGGEQP
jgi:mannose-6-phosphate isomerase-like protein (cupin superfamily)